MILLCITSVLSAQNFKENKRLTRTYRLNSQQIVEINNKYGKVEVVNWEKDSVKFVISFEMKAKTQEKLKKLENILNFNFAVSDYYVRATTIIGSSGGDLKTEIDNISNAFMTIGAEATIDYIVYMPAENRFKIKNSFGDIYLGNVQSNIDIDLAHGDLRIGKLSAFSTISIKFGKAFIQSFNEGNVNCQFSSFSLDQAGKINLISKSSNIVINAIKNLEIDSKRDIIELKEIVEIKGKLYFSRLTIYKVADFMNMETRFGSLNLEMIDKLFSGLTLSSDYTDITLIFQTGSSFSFSMTHSELSFNYPEDSAVLNSTLINKDNKQYKTTGVFGNAENAKAKVNISAVKGSLKIFFR